MVIVGQGEEHGVRLPLGRGAIAAGVIDDAALVVNEVRLVRLPQRPRTLFASADGAEHEKEHDQQPVLARRMRP